MLLYIFSFKLIEHLPRLIEMNREDILSAKERFGQMRRKPTVSTSQSYEGLSVRERKLEKARNLGVKLVPTFVAPSPPIDPIRRSVHNKKTASSTSTTNDAGANYTDRSTPEASMQLEEISSRAGESYQQSHVASNIPTPVRSKRPTNRSQRAGGGGSSAAVRTSYSTGALSQASIQYNQEGREVDSYYRSQADTGSSSAAATGGVSQRQASQRGLDRDKNAKESGSPKIASKPARSSRLGVFSRPKKKVSSHYEAILASKEKEKTTSRFRIKFPFGKGRVKELTAKIEPQADKAEPPKRPSPPKPAKQSPSVSPKHYFPPPKEPAPPPPREPAPPPPNGGSNVAPYNRGTVSSRPSIESNVPTYRRGPVSNKSSIESSIPVPSYHRGTNDISPTGANVPSFYRRGQQSASKPTTESHLPSYHRKPPSESNIPSYQQRGPPPNKQYSPKHEDQPSSSKLPPPAPKTYYRQILPRTPQATPAEAAVVNSRMSLYKVQPYLVPIRTQPPPEVVFIPGPSNEEEHPPSESPNKVSPPPVESTVQPQPQQVSTSSNTGSIQQATTSEVAATSSISKSNMSLDSIIEEYGGTSPSPSASQPPSETASSFPKEKERRPSFLIPSSSLEPAAHRQLEPPSSKTQTSSQSSTYTSKPTPQSSSKQTKTFTSKLPTYQSSTYTSKLPTPTSGSKPAYQSSTFSKKSTAAMKPPPVSGSSMSLDSILTDMENSKRGPAASNSNSPFRSQLPSEMAASSFKRKDRSSPSKAASSRPPSSLTNHNSSTEATAIGSSSMSLDSILDEFLKMSGTGDSSSSQTEVTQKPQLSTKERKDTSISSTSGHQELKEKEKKSGPISKLPQHVDHPRLESAPNPQQLDESKLSRQSQEVKCQESLLSQESASISHQEVKEKFGATGSSHPTLRSRQLRIRKERINFDSAPTSGQLQSKDKTELNSKPVPQARKLSRQEEQMSLDSAAHNGQPGGGNISQPVSKPKQLQRREELQSNPDLTSSVPTMSMSQNLVKLKVRANSAGTILDEEPEYSDPKDARKPSDTSNLSNGRISPTPKVQCSCIKDIQYLLIYNLDHAHAS